MSLPFTILQEVIETAHILDFCRITNLKYPTKYSITIIAHCLRFRNTLHCTTVFLYYDGYFPFYCTFQIFVLGIYMYTLQIFWRTFQSIHFAINSIDCPQ